MKGYNNFMSKKAFHPGSYANQKRIHEAEAKAEAKRKHDEETLAQYQKEQELFNQKSLVSKQSKEKLSLNFMYEAPPGVEKPDAKKANKVEWTSSSGKVETVINLGLPGTSSKTAEPSISLEWKREKPVKRSSSDKSSQSNSDVKKEIKEEPEIDLEWKRGKPIESKSSLIKHMSNIKDYKSCSNSRDRNSISSDIKPDIKRVKKER